MVDVVAYCRFSSDNQRVESIEAQERAIKEYCLKNNFNLIAIYKDEAISGTSIKDRESFIKMINDSKKKIFKYVIVHKFDRFARNRYDHAIYEKKLEDNGVKLLSVLEQLNDNPESVILKSVLTGMNEYYSLNLSREVKKGQKENALKCIHNGGAMPLGYDLGEDRRYVLNEKEAEIVKKIYKLYLNGVGYTKIAEILNEEGYKNKAGREFRKTSIRDFLLNEKYTGVFVYGKKDANGRLTGKEIKIENGCPQIISKEEFQKVQNMMGKRKTGARMTAITPYYLSGYCYCGECGGSYTGGYRTRRRNGTIDYGYLCINRKTKVNQCKNKPIIKEKLEGMVFDTIKKEIFTGKRIDGIANGIYKKIMESQSGVEKELMTLEKEIEKVTNKAVNLLNKNLEGNISDEVFNVMNEKINLELTTLKNKKNSLKSPVKIEKEKIFNYLKNLKDNFKNPQIKKSIVEAFIDSVIIYPNHVEIRVRDIPADMDRSGGDDGNRTRVRNYQRHRLLQCLVYYFISQQSLPQTGLTEAIL